MCVSKKHVVFFSKDTSLAFYILVVYYIFKYRHNSLAFHQFYL